MTLYQTLEDRDNIDEVEACGPFPCKKINAWMGEGFYFWDTFIELAHWWGLQGYKDKPYIICKSIVNFEEGELLDLEKPEVMMDFRNASKALPELYPEMKDKEPTVRLVLDALRKDKNFKYKAVRLRGTDSVNHYESIIRNRMNFPGNTRAYLDLSPAIQLCIYDKSKIGKDNFTVIYPETYCIDKDWVI